MPTWLEVCIPLFVVGGTVGFIIGYHKWMSTWVRPWLKTEVSDMQDIEDYANRKTKQDE